MLTRSYFLLSIIKLGKEKYTLVLPLRYYFQDEDDDGKKYPTGTFFFMDEQLYALYEILTIHCIVMLCHSHVKTKIL